MRADGARLASGNEAVVDAALAAGCRLFAGYPITPATEILEYAADAFPANGRLTIPAENEIAAIHMVAGASLAGYRAMTATTGIGLSLMAEALSFFSGMSELPGVVVCQQRWGPGDGSLGPGQDCYRQATRGVGHGDYHLIVLAPSSVQETADHVMLAFELADRYGMFVLVLGDQITALASELYHVDPPAEPPRRPDAFGPNPALGKQAFPILPELVAVDSKAGEFQALETLARRWERKYETISRAEPRFEQTGATDGADVLVVAYGSLGRTATVALRELEAAGVRAAVFRPVTLWPFPEDALREAASSARRIAVAELSMGQMIDDVRMSVGRRPDVFLNWLGGVAPSPEEFAGALAGALEEPVSVP